MTGCATCPASMLNAISCPMLSLPSITSLAPKYIVHTVTSLEIRATPPFARVPMVAVLKLEDT